MLTFHAINLIIHIASGFTALTVGVVPMVAQKGGKLHKRSGTVFFWAMFGVFITATASWLQHPEKPFLQFLLLVGFFSFHMALTGVRTLRLKKSADQPAHIDWFVAGVAMIAGTAAILFGSWQLYSGLTSGQSFPFFSILYLVFGVFFLRHGQVDWWVYSGRVQAEKLHWFFHHITRMVGAYIAAFTAFCVVNGDKIPLPSLVVWTLPGAIGGFFIARTIRYYKQKFDRKAAQGLSGDLTTGVTN
ncbi:MAG: DUF2306 domain-containing protein [Bacteroidetes bacterium]|nr:DUF2306 domain-containing protein [Fibrella sp.]